MVRKGEAEAIPGAGVAWPQLSSESTPAGSFASLRIRCFSAIGDHGCRRSLGVSLVLQPLPSLFILSHHRSLLRRHDGRLPGRSAGSGEAESGKGALQVSGEKNGQINATATERSRR
jgi:hypothetical protein